jgi:hypothetical protein
VVPTTHFLQIEVMPGRSLIRRQIINHEKMFIALFAGEDIGWLNFASCSDKHKERPGSRLQGNEILFPVYLIACITQGKHMGEGRSGIDGQFLEL